MFGVWFLCPNTSPGVWEAVFWMIWKTGSSPDPLTPDPKMAAKRWLDAVELEDWKFTWPLDPWPQDGCQKMTRCGLFLAENMDPYDVTPAFLLPSFVESESRFRLRCFTKMSRWFGLGISIEFFKWKGDHTCEDAQNLMGAPLITTTKHVLSYGNLALFFVVAHQLTTGVWWLESIDTSLKLAAHASKRWRAPKGSRIVFQPSIFRANSLLVSGRIILPGTYLSSIFWLQPCKTRPFLVKTRVIWVLGMYIYYTLYVRWNYNQPL